MSCKKGSFISIRHKDLRNLTANMMSKVCKDTEFEPKLTPLSGEELQGRTSNNSNEAKVDTSTRGFLGTRTTGILGQVDSTEFAESAESEENYNCLSSLIKEPKNYP